MTKTSYIFLILILFFASCGVKTSVKQMDSSKLDFFDSKLDDEMVYDLKGTWEFYWDTLLNPSQIQTTNLEPELVNIPNTWAEYNHSQNGKATYHIQLNVPPDNFYAFKFKRIFLSYKVWINDSVSLEVGKVSANIDDFVPNDLAKEFVFYADTNILNITIQVSNYNFRKAGITNVIKFGTPEAIEKLSYSSLLYEVFIIGALAFMMLFYFILFFYNKKVISNLYFSLFLLFEVITLGFDGELFFVRAFPGIGWVLASKIWNIASYLRPLFLLLFIEGLTRNKFSKFLKKSSIYFVVIMTLFIAFAPVKVYTHTIIIFIAFALGTLLYEIVITAVSIKDNKNIIFAFLGLVFILVSTLNDSLYDFGYINSFYSVGLGVFVYALLQAFLLSIKNAELFEKAENLTNSVEIQNRLKEALLSTPSYDISQSLYAFVETVGIEKIIIFSIEKDTIFISNIVEKDKSPVKINLVVDLSKDSSDFFIPVVKNAFEKQESAFFSNKNKIYIDEHKNNQFLKNNQIKTIVVIPVLENNKTIATIYLENRERALNNAQQSVLKSASAQFYSIINTAVAYFRLQEMNQYLEKEVKDRTLEVEKQKFEIDLKNQELDEKIQLLEEQYIIQQEINDELETQNLELEKQNIRLGVQNSEISKQKEELEKHNKQISDNIKYASTILSALKQEEENIPFRDFFVIDFPRDIVSGDFFWSKKIENKFIFALADSTGHGVPGALMSLLGIRLINKAVNKTFASNSDFTPANILNILRETIIKQLTDENQAIKDGFDMSFCIYNSDTKELSVSGAYNPIFIIRNNEIIHIKGDRMPIGSYIEGYEKPFSNNSLTLRENDIIYLFTDGYVDQFGGENYTKYYMANFKKLLIDIQKFPFKEQSDILIDTFKSWKRNNSQIDDVSIVSFLV